MTLALLVLASCGKKEKSFKELKETYLPKPEMTLTASDTANVKALVEHYMKLVEDREIDDAIGMLYYLDKDSVKPLRPEQAKNQRFILSHVKGVEYKLDHLVFRTEKDCEAHFTIKLFEPKPGNTRPNKVSMTLNPVRMDNKWYLTVNMDN
jgi:hypothetical protein